MIVPFSGSQATRFDITIAGETNLDLILYGLPEQMPVERELLASGFQVTLGGSSSILAHNLAMLGSSVGFVTQTGRDELGQIALDRLRESGVDLSHATYQEQVATGAMAEMKVSDLDVNYLASGRHFHLSSLFLQTGLQPDLPQLFSDLKRAGLTISLDTNDDPSDEWAGVLDQLLDRIDVLLPNEAELLRITRMPTLEQALDALCSRVPLIVVKCGSRGAVVQQGGSREWASPVLVQPVDTIGAGDSFNAGFLSSYLKGENALRSAAMGNVAGALSTLRAGGTEAFRDTELRTSFLSRHPIF
jgi:sugar/nucleoside kinase (ribokinase family)